VILTVIGATALTVFAEVLLRRVVHLPPEKQVKT